MIYTIILFINTIGLTKHKMFVPPCHRICNAFGKSTVALSDLGVESRCRRIGRSISEVRTMRRVIHQQMYDMKMT